jgi:hypothetical protein
MSVCSHALRSKTGAALTMVGRCSRRVAALLFESNSRDGSYLPLQSVYAVVAAAAALDSSLVTGRQDGRHQEAVQWWSSMLGFGGKEEQSSERRSVQHR